jgi:hypothetical protein
MKQVGQQGKLGPKNRVISLMLLLLVLFAYKAAYDVYFREPYCEQEARQIIGIRWTDKVPATELDKQHWPGIIQSDGTVFKGMHQIVKCESSHNAFIIF